MTREEKNRRQREYRRANGDAHTKRYEKTPKGFLMRCYRNMQSRITGIQKQKYHLYMGKSLLPRSRFYQWAEGDTNFTTLFEQWRTSGYDRKLTPSVNRIDTSKGYQIGNIEWITHSENSRLGAISPVRKTSSSTKNYKVTIHESPSTHHWSA
jgi:hypothetical protein